MQKFELNRTIQCANCPWKVGADPFKIKGYSEVLHRELACTIAEGFNIGRGTLPVMSCHHSKEGQEEHCVGWLFNQLGPGNNIALRMQMLNCTNLKDVQVVGDQQERFEDTLPKNVVLSVADERPDDFEIDDFDDDDFQCCDNCDLPDACADFGCAIESGVREDDFMY